MLTAATVVLLFGGFAFWGAYQLTKDSVEASPPWLPLVDRFGESCYVVGMLGLCVLRPLVHAAVVWKPHAMFVAVSLAGLGLVLSAVVKSSMARSYTGGSLAASTFVAVVIAAAVLGTGLGVYAILR